MNTTRPNIILLLCFILCCGFLNPQSSGDLKVVVNGVRNNTGAVYISLYNSANGFPTNTEKALVTQVSKIMNQTAEVTFKDIGFGVYAVAAYHDENGNKVLDKNFMGIPKEGVGVSNNAKGHFGPPKYDDAKFNLTKTGQTVVISIRYL